MREHIAESLGPITMSDLGPHLARDAVIVVAPSLELLDVGEAIAADDAARVDAWVLEGLVGKPTLEALERWGRVKGPFADAVVVQPFVLVRERVG